MRTATKRSITQKVRRFYERYSFPGYETIDDLEALTAKASANLYVKMLLDQLPHAGRILELGCGTGQLTNLLSVDNRRVIGIDLSLNSLRQAETFRRRQFLDTAKFIQMDIFHPCFRPQTFDVTISNGVLHHTPNPQTAFSIMVSLTKPGGLIILGLYNRFGRALTNLRRHLFRYLGRVDFLDYYLSRKDFPESKKQVWFKDQYQNPHESHHAVDEILNWFDQKHVKFLNAIPKITFLDSLTPKERLFTSHRRGSRLEHLLSQFLWIFTQAREGGLFVLIGQKQS